jgi:hypothetical protein
MNIEHNQSFQTKILPGTEILDTTRRAGTCQGAPKLRRHR